MSTQFAAKPSQHQKLDIDLETRRNNDPLPHEMQQRIRGLISEAQDNVDLLDLEISKAHAPSDELLALRGKQSARITTLRGAISPLKEFPPEILGKIFVLCKVRKAIVVPPNFQVPPWTLGRVCSRWRQVLWSTPELWSHLEIHNDPSHREVITIPAAARSIVSRSNGLISLTAPVLTMASALDTIISFPNRFKSLNLRIDHDAFCAMLELPTGSFAHLEALDILIRQRHLNPDFPVYTRTSLQTASNLRSFSIRGAEFSTCPPHLLLLPWGQITRLHWAIKIPPSTVYSILAQCTSLLTCEIYVRSEVSQAQVETGHILVPNLHSFSLNFGGSGILDWDSFLRPFELPTLKDFRVYTYSSHLSHQTLISLINRSACILSTLSLTDHSIRGYEFGDQGNYDFLQALPSLEVFETSFIIPAATFDAISHGLIPRLQSLKCGVHPKGFHAFLDLMEYYMQMPSAAPYRGVLFANIGCYEALGIDEAYKRFRKASPLYVKDGRDITVSRTRL